MRKVLLVGMLGALLAAPTAEAAVTLDPGTKLTVVCEQKKPFRGEPFGRTIPHADPLSDRLRFGLRARRLRIGLGHVFVNERDTHHITDVTISVTPKGSHRFRLRVWPGSEEQSEPQPVTWRGC